ncbi:hypothetical protein Tco_0754342 [Tanacetum coccineum]
MGWGVEKHSWQQLGHVVERSLSISRCWDDAGFKQYFVVSNVAALDLGWTEKQCVLESFWCSSHGVEPQRDATQTIRLIFFDASFPPNPCFLAFHKESSASFSIMRKLRRCLSVNVFGADTERRCRDQLWLGISELCSKVTERWGEG